MVILVLVLRLQHQHSPPLYESDVYPRFFINLAIGVYVCQCGLWKQRSGLIAIFSLSFYRREYLFRVDSGGDQHDSGVTITLSFISSMRISCYHFLELALINNLKQEKLKIFETQNPKLISKQNISTLQFIQLNLAFD